MVDFRNIVIPTLSVEDVQAFQVDGRYAIIMRDPQPDEVRVPNGSTISLRIVDLDANDPYSPVIKVNIYVDQGTGLVLAYSTDGGGFTAGWSGPGSAFRTSADYSDNYAWNEFVLDQSPAQMPSEGVVLVRVQLIDAENGFGASPFGLHPFGHAGGVSNSTDVYYEFTAADTVKPQIVNALAIAPRFIRVTFDEPVVGGTGGVDDPSSWVIVRENVSPHPAVTLDVVGASPVAYGDGSVWDLETHWEQTPGCVYHLSNPGTINDDSGNAIEPVTVDFDGYVPDYPAWRRFSRWALAPSLG